MTDEQRKHLEQRLLQERERAARALERFDRKQGGEDDDGELTGYPFHMADEGTDTMEREKDFLLASNEGRQLIRIDEALRVLYKTPERYGLCINCDGEIIFERLDIVPWALLCMECQQRDEEGRGAAA
jgi:DnaK suppressor protein